MLPINASVSASTSSGAQGGNVNLGDFIVGGSGGVNKASVPTVAILGVLALGGLLFLGWLIMRK